MKPGWGTEEKRCLIKPSCRPEEKKRCLVEPSCRAGGGRCLMRPGYRSGGGARLVARLVGPKWKEKKRCPMRHVWLGLGRKRRSVT